MGLLFFALMCYDNFTMNENNLVLYRKYRPKTFKEVVGQEYTIRTLTNAVSLGRVAHAYLFAGPRGTGKTTVARLLAKAINCEKSPSSNYEPCNKCVSCQEINEAKSLDLIEVDAASNRGIDEIRELRDKIRFAPTRSKHKVYIIDEVHMLTKEAFNALLKTLEEPPEHAIFVLATTEIHRVPATVLSRCQRFDFKKLTLGQIVSRLKDIALKEKVEAEQEALELIGISADGSMRDGESLLNQVITLEDKIITLKEVQEILGATDPVVVEGFSKLLAQKDIPEALKFINKLAQDGYDIHQFTKALVGYLRKVLILKIDASLAKVVASEMTEEQIKKSLELATQFEPSELLKITKLFIEAENEIKSSLIPQLPLELAVVEIDTSPTSNI